MKDEELILGKCVAEEDALRPVFEKPYDGVDGWVYGCDRRMFVRIRKECCDGAYPENAKGCVTADMVGWGCDLYVAVGELASAIGRCPLVDEEVGGEEEVECEECDGEGTVECEYWSSVKGRYYSITCECPVCEGLGYVAKDDVVKTGRKVVDPTAIVAIDGIGFKVMFLQTLKEVAEMLGVEVLHIVNLGKARAMVVQLTDDVQFGVMPNTNRADVSIETRRAEVCR